MTNTILSNDGIVFGGYWPCGSVGVYERIILLYN